MSNIIERINKDMNSRPSEVTAWRATMHDARAEITDADKALCALLDEFGWATGHGDTLVDLIGELAANLQQYRKAAELTKHLYGECLKDAERALAPKVRPTIQELEAILASEDDRQITINADGSISSIPAAKRTND